MIIMTEKFEILGKYIKDLSSETPDIETTPVSFPSKILSSVGVNDAVPVVDPAETVILESDP